MEITIKLMQNLILLAAYVFSAWQADATELTTIRVASGLSAPVYVTSPSGDHQRIFIVEQPGSIRILKNGNLLPAPFLDINERVSYGGERGLLGLAFHPNYSGNGYLYVNYANNSGNTVISRFQVTANPDSAAANSEFILLTIGQPFSNHNGGMIVFGSGDGYLYIGMGDGGGAGDSGNRAQDDAQLLGKLLRIDVDGGAPYAIPPDNPFAGPGYPLDEIWAKGMRNPWRFSFDRLTGDMFIADVGQNAWEEVDFQAASSAGGENYGWRLMEGFHCYNPPNNCDPGGLTYPIYEYSHSNGCSITGGYVYRGNVIPHLQGTYFFADFCSDRIWSFRYINNNIAELLDRTAELTPGGGMSIASISSFGEDVFGELYIADLFGGEIFKIVPENPGAIAGIVRAGQLLQGVDVVVEGTAIADSSDVNGHYILDGLGDGFFDISFSHPEFGDTTVSDVEVSSGDTTILNMIIGFSCDYIPGDINGDGDVLGSDITYGIGYFRGLGAPPPDSCFIDSLAPWLYSAGDANGSCRFSGSDITFLVSYFKMINPDILWCRQTPPSGMLSTVDTGQREIPLLSTQD